LLQARKAMPGGISPLSRVYNVPLWQTYILKTEIKIIIKD